MRSLAGTKSVCHGGYEKWRQWDGSRNRILSSCLNSPYPPTLSSHDTCLGPSFTIHFILISVSTSQFGKRPITNYLSSTYSCHMLLASVRFDTIMSPCCLLIPYFSAILSSCIWKSTPLKVEAVGMFGEQGAR